MTHRAGYYKQNMKGKLAYQSFFPKPIPLRSEIEMCDETIDLLVKAVSKVAILDSLALHIKNIDLFISMYVRKEALMSSQIEGTQATLEDILDPMIEENANNEVAEVINYIKALEYGIKRLDSLPISRRFIKEIHGILMKGSRGEEKTPGEFRCSQNWIGGAGSTLKNATYIPPNVEDMLMSVEELEKYIHLQDWLDPLIKVALIHYQFETIHPFLDGNGRVGRLLIILFLIDKKILSTPALYISYSLKINRVEYYDRLMEVRKKGDFEQWVKFFLRAIFESAEHAIDKIYQSIELRDESIRKIMEIGRVSKNTLKVFEYLEANPIIDIRKTATALGLAYNTVSSVVKKLVEIGILTQVDDQKRNRLFAYHNYLEILRDGTH